MKTKKRVFLLTTTVGDILLGGRAFVNRMEELLRISSTVEDRVMIWRPHPLSLSTIQSMRPEIMDKYSDLVKRFKAGTGNIYDETADYQQAIAIADAYIGTMSSSLFSVFRVTGKPMYTVNSEWNTLVESGIFLGTASAAVGDKLFLFSAWFNGLFSIDCLSGRVDFVCAFIRRPGIGRILHLGAYVYKHVIFFLPFNSREVVAYNQLSGEVVYIPLELDENGKLDRAVDGCNMYLLPNYCTDFVYVIDMEKYTAEKRWMTKNTKISQKQEYRLAENEVGLYCQIINDCVYRVCSERSIQCCHLKSGRITYHRLSCESKGFKSVNIEGDNAWLLSYGYEDIIVWNMKSNQLVSCLKLPENVRKEQFKAPFLQIAYWGSYMWLIPKQANFIIKINIYTKQMICIDINIKGFHKILPDAVWCYEYQIKEDNMYLFPYGANMILCVDMINDNVNAIPINYSPVQYNKIHNHKLEEVLSAETDGIYNEAICGLETFITIVEQGDAYLRIDKYADANQTSTSGSEIWALIKEKVC